LGKFGKNYELYFCQYRLLPEVAGVEVAAVAEEAEAVEEATVGLLYTVFPH
jgi:hypothetical protein